MSDKDATSSSTDRCISKLARGALRASPDVADPLLDEAYRSVLAPWIRGFIARRGCPPSDLDDLVQEVFRRLLASRASYRGNSEREFWAFVTGICRSVISHWRRKRSAHWVRSTDVGDDWFDASIEADSPNEGAGEESSEAQAQLAHALSFLTPLQRSIIHLRYQGNCSLRSTALVLNRSLSTVAEAERAALRALERQMQSVSPKDRNKMQGVAGNRERTPKSVSPATPPNALNGTGNSGADRAVRKGGISTSSNSSYFHDNPQHHPDTSSPYVSSRSEPGRQSNSDVDPNQSPPPTGVPRP